MPASSSDEIAVVMTVRNEQELLRENILYHQFMGVSQFYLYDDGSTDGTVGSVSDLPSITWAASIPVDAVEITPDLAAAARRHESYFVGRQLLNTQHAKLQARADGYRWIVFIDADELVAVDRLTPVRNSLKQLLNGQNESVEGVIFPVLEVLQRRDAYHDVMAEETLFKVATSGAMRETYDPFEKRQHRVDSTYGHKAGKMAVRLDIDSVPWSSHRFRAPGGKKLRAVELGDLLHYYAPDFESFVHKFRTMKDHPDQHLDGRTVVIQKRLWRDVVNKSGMTDAELRDYYARWVMFDDEDVERMRRARRFGLLPNPAVVEVTSVAAALKEIEATGAAG